MGQEGLDPQSFQSHDFFGEKADVVTGDPEPSHARVHFNVYGRFFSRATAFLVQEFGDAQIIYDRNKTQFDHAPTFFPGPDAAEKYHRRGNSMIFQPDRLVEKGNPEKADFFGFEGPRYGLKAVAIRIRLHHGHDFYVVADKASNLPEIVDERGEVYGYPVVIFHGFRLQRM